MDKADRAEIYARLQEICETHDGRITPELTVGDAADPSSPLHPLFEWDDTKAAHAHRLDQARQLLRSVKVVVRRDDKKIVVPYYVRDPDAGDEQGYTSMARLKTEKERAAEVAANEFKMAAATMRRARAIAEALGVEERVDEIIAGIDSLRSEVSAGLPGKG